MYFIHLIMAILATYRLTELFAVDKITEGFRKRFVSSYLLRCGRCLTVWAGIASTLTFAYCPWLNWPFALSWAVFALSDLKSAKGRKFIAVLNEQGQGKVVKSDFLPEEVASMCNAFFPQKTEEVKETA
jgi:hypothetical protein